VKFSRHSIALLISLALFAIAGCSSSVSKDVSYRQEEDISKVVNKPAAAPAETDELRISTAPAAVKPNFVTVKVFYATDRSAAQDKDPSRIYGTERSAMTYGTCQVSIPGGHRIGNLESPKIYKFEFKPDPKKHVTLMSVSVMNKDLFFADLKDTVANSQKKSAFVFVHGYNTSFADAARRTAQIAHDLEFDGAPVFFSWPSKQVALEYPHDETNIEWAEADLKRFLGEFAELTGAENVYLIAHSMGNRALARAFASIASKDEALTKHFREVILTAPDIDSGVFMNEIAPKITGFRTGVTLYSSSNDDALALSRRFHGYPRAGDSGAGLVVAPGIETIDASEVDTSLFGHSYFAGNRSVIEDMHYLIKDGKRAGSRFSLAEKQAPAGKYWAFKK
jgi:esterase/lipase superfamily enzyme